MSGIGRWLVLVGVAVAAVIGCSGGGDEVATEGEAATEALPHTGDRLRFTARLSSATNATALPASTWVDVQPGDGTLSDRDIEAWCSRAPAFMRKAERKGWLSWSAVEITGSVIRVDGLTVQPLIDGRVPAGSKRGMLISPLFDALKERDSMARATAEQWCQPSAGLGELLLIVDRQIPFSLLREVIYTAGQARFDGLSFAVQADSSSNEVPSVAGLRQLQISLTSEGGMVVADHSGEGYEVGGPAGIGTAVDTLFPSRTDLGCALLAVAPAASFSELAATLGELRALGLAQPMIATLTAPNDDVAAVPAEPEPRHYLLDSTVMVLRSQPQAIARPGTPSTGECGPVVIQPLVGRKPVRPR